MQNLLPSSEFRYFLTYNNERTEIFAAPRDWDSDTIGKFKRDESYSGIMRTLSLPISFVLDGYSLITLAFNNDGYEAEVLFECQQINRQTFSYDYLFSSNLDFSQYKDNGIEASVMLLESGVSATIRAKEDTKYEYPLTGLDVVNIRIPGVVFSEKGDFITPSQTDNLTNDYIASMDLVNNDTNSGYVTLQNTENEEDPNFATSGNWFARANRPITVNVKGTILGNVFRQPLATSTNFFFSLRNQSGAAVYSFGNVLITSADLTKPFNFTIDAPISLANNDRLFLYVSKTNGSGGGSPNWATFSSEGELVVSYTQVSDPSNCKGVKAYDLFSRVIRRIAPTQPVDSFLLKNDWNGLIITCGNAIRELANASIQTTLKDFFKTFNAIESVGMGFDTNVLRLEKRPFFFRPYKTDTLTGVKGCEFSVYTEGIFNSVQMGYNDGNTDDIDGQYEYNSRQQWSMPLVRIQRPEDWVSPYRADQYGIEKLRVDFIKKTNDTSSDNDVFMIDCRFDGTNWNPIKSSDDYVSVTGMANEAAGQAAYNLRLTPKENLIRHGSYLTSMLDKMEERFIEFASAEKNKNLAFVRIPNTRIVQSESINVASLTGKYFRPIVATLQAKLPRGFMSRMTTNSFGYLEWDWQGMAYRGYILEVDVDLAKNSERELKLLLTDAMPFTTP